MISRKQDYLSSISKNLGLALFTPFGSLLFQWIVFKKDISADSLYYSIGSLFVGILFLVLGYIIIRD
ncbi:MAG: hypothetical protein HY094_01840 [Candidatus Melainabacteria bacterium]|nr:hypothetical protein [Candidatus Melainabacteria bacterium]